MRVCILANTCPGTWIDHYIRAFRAVCETIVVGAPAPRRSAPPEDETTGETTLLDAAPAYADIECDLSSAQSLPELLGSRWPVDLVVGIADDRGRPLHPQVAHVDCPTALITATSWRSHSDFMEAVFYDFVFTAQRSWISLFRATGSRQVYWLPMACAPEAHYPVAVQERYDFAFAGSVKGAIYQERQRLLELLRANDFSVRERHRVTGAKYCRTYARGRLAFNHSAIRDVNARLFEAMAMGRPVLTNADAEVNGLFDLFDEGMEIITYDSDDELLRKARLYLGNELERHALANRGREKVLALHTYRNRVRELLYTIKTNAPDPNALPGPKLKLERFEGSAMENYLPTSPGTVVDMGLTVHTSRFALRRRAVKRVVGLSESGGGPGLNASNYDAVIDWPGSSLRDADTVLLAPEAVSHSLEECLRVAHAVLEPGGTLVLRMRPEDREEHEAEHDPDGSLNEWLHGHDFVLRMLGEPQPDGRRIIQARKRTRTIADVLAGLYQDSGIPVDAASEALGAVPAGA